MCSTSVYSVLSFIVEEGRSAMDGAKSASAHGCALARPSGTIKLKMPQASEGLNIREKDFCLLFVF